MKSLLLQTLSLIATWALCSLSLQAQNTCATAITLDATQSVCIPVSGNNNTATASGATPTPACGSFGSGVDVWYSFVAPASGNVTISTTAGTLTDMAMSLYSGTCGSLTQVECDDDDGPGLMPEIMRTGLTAGDTYFVRLWDFGSNNTGTFSICITAAATIPNTCATATMLDASSIVCTPTAGAINGSITASGITPTPSCGSFGSGVDIWYSFVAPASGSVTISTTAGTLTDMAMSLYSGTCGSLTEVECDDDDGAGSMPAITRTGLTAGDTYFVRLWDFGSNNTGTFSICVTSPPANDAICNAVGLNINGGCELGSNAGTTSVGDPATPACFSSLSNSVWYSFVATDDSLTVSTDFTGSELTLTDTEVAVYSSSNNTCSGSLTLIGCDDDSGIGSTNKSVIEMTGLTVGNTYFVLVDGEGSATGTFCLSVYETQPPKPIFGSSCDKPHVMYPSSTSGLYAGNNVDVDANGFGNSEGINGSCGDTDTSQDVFWVQFTANSTTTTVRNDAAGNIDYALFTGTCGALTEVDCHSNVPNFSTRDFTTTIGETYLMMVSNNSGTDTDRSLTLTSTAICATPANDNCANAIAVTEGVAYTLSTACATPDQDLCSGNTDNNIWMRWTAPADWPAGQAAFVVLQDQDCGENANASNGTQISLYNANTTCAGTASVGFSDCIFYNNPQNDLNFYANFIAQAGQSYLINIDGYAGDACTFRFQVNNAVPFIPQPVTLSSFEAKINNANKVNLSWLTTSEINFKQFVLQRSDKGVIFEDMATIQAKGYNQPHLYEFLDQEPWSGQNYYRLKQIDNDGTVTYSKIVNAYIKSNQTAEPMKIYPIPALPSQSFYIELNANASQEGTLTYYDLTGRSVSEEIIQINSGRNKVHIQPPKLKTGLYLLKVVTQQQSYTGKLIVR